MILYRNVGATASITAVRLPKVLSYEWGGGGLPLGKTAEA